MRSPQGYISPINVSRLLAMGGRRVELCDRVTTAANPTLGIPAKVAWSCRAVTGYIAEKSQQWAIAGGTTHEDGRLMLYLDALSFDPATLTDATAIRHHWRYYRAIAGDHICQQQGGQSVPLVYVYSLQEWDGTQATPKATGA